MNRPTFEEIMELRDQALSNAKSHGFHDCNHSNEHYKCLIMSELMESVEADRHDRHANLGGFYESEATHPDFVERFEGYIKDTVEDELADTVIRFLDLCGLRGGYVGKIDWDNICRLEFTGMTFTETAWVIACTLCGPFDINVLLGVLFVWADHLGFDLMEHIRLKMEYNRTRETLHGKKY